MTEKNTRIDSSGSNHRTSRVKPESKLGRWHVLAVFLAIAMATHAVGDLPGASDAIRPDKELNLSRAESMFSLAGQAGLPVYLKSDPLAIADDKGLVSTRGVRTLSADFIERDFILDLVFTPGIEGRGDFWAGLGANRWDGNWILDSVVARLDAPHGDRHGQMRLAINRNQVDVGPYANTAGPHLMRIEKEGNTLTFSIYADDKAGHARGNPALTIDVPDLKVAAPFLNNKNAALFFGGGATFHAVRLIVDGKPVGARPVNAKPVDGKPVDPEAPAAEKAPIAKNAAAAAPAVEETPLFSLAGQAGLPTGFRSTPTSLADERGLRGELRSIAADYGERDFTFDLVFQFTGSEEREMFFIGLGDNTEGGGRAGNAIALNVHGPQYGDFAVLGEICIPGHDVIGLGAIKGEEGPFLIRLQKIGKRLTIALGAAPEGDKPFEATFSKTIPDITVAAPALNKRTGRLFVTGIARFAAMRLIVDGEAVVAGSKEPAADAIAVKMPPLFRLAGSAGLPAYLKANAQALADERGIRGGQVRTVAADLIDHDFVLDLLFRFDGKDGSSFLFGIGENGRHGAWVTNSVWSGVRDAGDGGWAGIGISEHRDEQLLGRFGEDNGPHLLRIQKTGQTLTFSLCLGYQDTFEPTFSKTIPDIKAAAPFLTAKNSCVFFSTERGSGACFQAVRLTIDGKPIDTGRPDQPPAVADRADPADETPLYTLGGSSGLPSYLEADPAMLADANGLRGGEIRTALGDFLNKDFTFDLLYQFEGEQDQSIFLIGIGENAWEGNWLKRTVASRVHGPGHDGVAMVSIADQPESTLVKTGRDQGPHMFRLSKRGDALTMSICAGYQGKFEATSSRTIPNIRSVAPFLTAKNSSLFIAAGQPGGGRPGNCTFQAVRLVVGGEAVDPGPSPRDSATVKAAAMLNATDHFVRLTPDAMPPYLEKRKDLSFDPAGGLLFADGDSHKTRAANFVDHDFIFDVVYRFPPDGGREVVIGIGENRWEGNWIANSVCARLGGPAHEGAAGISIGRSGSTLSERTGREAGPHLFRLMKAGATLTMAIWTGYDPDKPLPEQPDARRTIPDLASVAPFLNSKNSPLFIHAIGNVTIDQVRLLVDGAPVESRELRLSFPARVVEGQAVRQTLIAPADAGLARGKRLIVESAPKGLTLTPAGELSWTPTSEQVGAHEVKVLIEGAGGEGNLSEQVIEVVSAEDAAAVNGDLSKLDALHRLELVGEQFELTPGLGRQSILLLERSQLRRLGPDGLSVLQSIDLPHAYQWIREREAYFVALSGEEKRLDLIDAKTLKVIRSIKMDYRQLFDLALHPTKPVCYVTVEKIGLAGPRADILIVEENSGDVLEPEGFTGRWIEVSPDGKLLYAATTGIAEQADRLIVYDVSGAVPKPVRAKQEAGAAGLGLELSPDGRRLSYLSASGYPLQSGNVPAWNPADLTRRPVSYPAKAHEAHPGTLAFHPFLDLVALAAGSRAVIFNRETGDVEPTRLGPSLLPASAPVSVKDLFFSPDGENIILVCHDEKTNEAYLRKTRLRLRPDELKVRTEDSN